MKSKKKNQNLKKNIISANGAKKASQKATFVKKLISAIYAIDASRQFNLETKLCS